eukprot:CAMPEP_0172507236 /NCGR_PEP_ID=MMETSP1066-20121228/202498_1 /TAXON_ID=671091 /ORGANISM="Coscinodiscus wailesii, Strain CCMP2513" /LENGTH=202 /DNA_ID=CAMNT_0013284721 /DNA_START=185 /DNA_END=793 /DNA_ORIENTATION=+
MKSKEKTESELEPKVDPTTASQKDAATLVSEIHSLIDPLINSDVKFHHSVPNMYVGSNESDGDGVEVFVIKAPTNIDNDDDIKTALDDDWNGESRDEYFITGKIKESSISSWFNSQIEEQVEDCEDMDLKDTQNAHVIKVLALIARVEEAPKKLAAVLNSSGGKVFQFAVRSDGNCVYRVGVGCVTSDGYLVGWQENHIVWT